MDLLEYQGKQYFAKFGIAISPGDVASTAEEAVAIAERIGYPVVIKAQVQIGGRGKQGGIQFGNNADETREKAAYVLGLTIYDRTGTIGYPVERVWIERSSDIADDDDEHGKPRYITTESGEQKRKPAEYYASFTLDRSKKLHLGMLSREGGVEIESVPDEDIAKIWIDPTVGLPEAAAREWVAAAKLNPKAQEGAVDILQKLYRCYVEGDASLAEINPLILTPAGEVRALDAKVSLDEAASYRHPEWAEFGGLESRDEREREAEEKDLQYVGLEGSVGIIANGAGLAMSTVDIVNQVGGKPANFLDIGGGANADRMVDALTVINHDHNVKAIFINIFGGITRCDEVARGIVEATKRIAFDTPIIVRLDGTNAKEGREILNQHLSDKLLMQPDMLTAAKKAIEIAAARA